MVTSTLIIFTVINPFNEFEQHESMIQQMYDTVLDHEKGWSNAKTTILICQIIPKANPIILKNDPSCQGNKHAEELLIEKLNSIDKSLLTTITIYINNSPCSSKGHNCIRQLLKFLNENQNIILILYVTNLYNIRRRSCFDESHYRWVSETDHEVNFLGLKNMMKHGQCVVSAFSYAAWSELLNIVSVSEEFKSKLLTGNNIKWCPNDRQRAKEDCLIRNELHFIMHHPLYLNNHFM